MEDRKSMTKQKAAALLREMHRQTKAHAERMRDAASQLIAPANRKYLAEAKIYEDDAEALLTAITTLET
jgi:dsDNA-specific endonuclease/ATPase MutS2